MKSFIFWRRSRAELAESINSLTPSMCLPAEKMFTRIYLKVKDLIRVV